MCVMLVIDRPAGPSVHWTHRCRTQTELQNLLFHDNFMVFPGEDSLSGCNHRGKLESLSCSQAGERPRKEVPQTHTLCLSESSLSTVTLAPVLKRASRDQQPKDYGGDLQTYGRP